ncbi:MAG TPA: methyl-accepting chemotaxis protein [Firmicutes bacterium]|nr:methyl-accepting chemotaxis protein [Bacillota bacterium]
MKIKTKLIWGYIVLSLLVVFVTVVSLYSVNRINRYRDSIDKMNQTITILEEFRLLFTGQANDERGFLLTGKPEFGTEIQEKAHAAQQITEILKTLMEQSQEQELLKRIEEEHRKFTAINLQVLDLYGAGKTEEALELSFNEGRKVRKDLDSTFKALVDIQENENTESKRNVVALTERLKIVITVISALVILMGIMLGYILAKSIVNPINKIALHMKKGDLNFSEMIVNEDEVGQLTLEFGKLVKNIRQMVAGVQSGAEQVAASSQQLSASAEQSAVVSGQIASSITAVAQGADQQLQAVTDTLGVVEHISASVQQIAANSAFVTASADKAAKEAAEGGKVIELAVGKMADIEKTVNQSAAVVGQLGERSQEIGKIIDTIAGIAAQTNLLSLNAAIEAARAGEQGRGFAVVAEEVRKLAEQSQEAAKHIAELIGSIQSDTGNAVASMVDGTREVRSGSDMVNAAGQAFGRIIGLIAEVSRQISDISRALDQQARDSQEIVVGVRGIDKISRDASAQTQTISAATEEQSATMEEIASSSRVLAELAEKLQVSVQQFSV